MGAGAGAPPRLVDPPRLGRPADGRPALGDRNTSLGLSPIPSFQGWGWVLLAVASLVSIQVGRGQLWPGRPRGGAVGRLLLLAVNLAAVACLPVTLDRVATPSSVEPLLAGDSQGAATYDQGYADASSQYDRAGMYVNGHWVSNIYPYDAAGRPLVGVQLFDQTGQPVGVKPQTECVYTPPRSRWTRAGSTTRGARRPARRPTSSRCRAGSRVRRRPTPTRPRSPGRTDPGSAGSR